MLPAMAGLTFDDHRTHADTVIAAVIAAADPRRHVAAALRDIKPLPESVRLVAFGKASVAMTQGAGDILGDRIRFGIAAAPSSLAFRPEQWPANVGLMPADHPLPTERNVEAARAIEYVARDCGDTARRRAAGSSPASPVPSPLSPETIGTETLLVLISGGGSAHLTSPSGDVTVDDLRRLTDAMNHAGATIAEINTVRRHCEGLKGGRLAALAHPAPVIGLILSDVVGDDPATIASGPMSADATTFTDALVVLDKYKLRNLLPRIAAYIEDHRGDEAAETVKKGDPRLRGVFTRVVASNHQAVKAAEETLRAIGFATVATREGVEGEASEVGRALARQALEMKRGGGGGGGGPGGGGPGGKGVPLPAAIIWGGETTVRVGGVARRADGEEAGRGLLAPVPYNLSPSGGRNQELALAAAIALDGRPDIAVLTFATDGIDGPTDAAGVLVSGATLTQTQMLGLDGRAALADHDSHTFFARLEAGGHPVTLYRTGPTGTNVNDIAVALVY